jgi:ribosomal protein S3
MGQKVHPSGFRVGITKKHQSQWFARFNKNKYSQTVLEDRMIRDTLNKLFPELLNPSTKGDTKRDQNARIKKSRITQIKIERHIVPYQIGIQIHAENCNLLKSAIKNLQVKREILVKLQKTRQYLTNLKVKLDSLTNTPADLQSNKQEGAEFRSLANKKGLINQPNTKLSKIKALRKKLAKLKTTANTNVLNRPFSKRKQFSKKSNGLAFTNKDGQSSSLSQLLKIKLLRAKLAKLIEQSSAKPKLKKKTQELETSGVRSITSTTKTVSIKKKTSIKRKSMALGDAERQNPRRFASLGQFETKLTKRQLKRQRILKKRLRLRKFIRSRDLLLISKGLFLQKKGAKLTKKLALSPTPKFLKDFSLNPKVYLLPVQKIERNSAQKFLSTKKASKAVSNSAAGTAPLGVSESLNQSREASFGRTSLQANIYNARIQKKFVTMYVEQMKKKFLPHLNELFLQYTSNNKATNLLSLGYSKKWAGSFQNDFEHRYESLKKQPIEKLNILVQNLREKFVIKLNLLRKEFIAFGSFSCNSSEILGLFQLYNFIMKLKELVNTLKLNLKHKIKTRLAISKMSGTSLHSIGSNNMETQLITRENNLTANPRLIRKSSSFYTNENSLRSNKLRIIESLNSSLPQKVFRQKLENISNECRKMKFIEYLKDLVQKHRTDNIYLYLASISESRKKLKEIKNEVKEHLDFYLPGATTIKDLIKTQNTDSINNATNQVSNILMKLAKKHPFDKTFADCKFEELERRKTMWVKNLQCMPKISIKFFSVNQKALNLKASVISESVVDALEKRKAFRKVIKSTKENLMRNSEIKGVKIQVAGRLNGAEIARTEWVRAGRVPLQTLRANLDYSYRTANTIYGIIGVKVWIFKGFTKLVTQ